MVGRYIGEVVRFLPLNFLFLCTDTYTRRDVKKLKTRKTPTTIKNGFIQEQLLFTGGPVVLSDIMMVEPSQKPASLTGVSVVSSDIVIELVTASESSDTDSVI